MSIEKALHSEKTNTPTIITIESETPPTLTLKRYSKTSGRILAQWTCCTGECEGAHITPKALVSLLLRDGHPPNSPTILLIPPFFFRQKQKGPQ